jgi:DNA-binding response OmpR family regulator
MDMHAADYCPTCGQPRERGEPAISYMGLTLHLGTLTFAGRSTYLRPAHRQFVHALLERGRASSEFLLLRVCPETESNMVAVYACQIRRIIRNLTNDAIKLQTIWGWGFKLVENSVSEAKAA